MLKGGIYPPFFYRINKINYMRARTVKPIAYVFDFDQTLVKTQAMVHILKDGKRIKSITPEEFNTYTPSDDESYDTTDFSDPRIIYNAEKYKSWAELENINKAIRFGKRDAIIYILTARSPKSQIPIFNFLKRNGISISLDNVITIGNDEGYKINTAIIKKKILEDIAKKYNVYFFDDSDENIKAATLIPGVSAKLIDWKI